MRAIPHNGLRELREQAGLSQVQLSRMLGCHRSIPSLWEQGRALVPSSRIEALAQAFGVSEDAICDAAGVRGIPRTRGGPIPLITRPDYIDPEDRTAWLRVEDDAQDGAQRYIEWARNEERLKQVAERTRGTGNRPRYMHSYGEPLMGGPSPVPGRPKH